MDAMNILKEKNHSLPMNRQTMMHPFLSRLPILIVTNSTNETARTRSSLALDNGFVCEPMDSWMDGFHATLLLQASPTMSCRCLLCWVLKP